MISSSPPQSRELARWVSEYRAGQRQRIQTITIGQDEVTVREMTAYLKEQLDRAGNSAIDGLRPLADQPTCSRRACLFLGILELVRGEQLQIEQQEPFAPLWLRRAFASAAKLGAALLPFVTQSLY